MRALMSTAKAPDRSPIRTAATARPTGCGPQVPRDGSKRRGGGADQAAHWWQSLIFLVPEGREKLAIADRTMPLVGLPGRTMALNGMSAGRNVSAICPARQLPCFFVSPSPENSCAFSRSLIGFPDPADAHDLYLALIEGEENGAIQHSW